MRRVICGPALRAMETKQARGHRVTKLTAEQIAEIRRRQRAPQKVLAYEYGVCASTISHCQQRGLRHIRTALFVAERPGPLADVYTRAQVERVAQRLHVVTAERYARDGVPRGTLPGGRKFPLGVPWANLPPAARQHYRNWARRVLLMVKP